jgi:hypothetical protein
MLVGADVAEPRIGLGHGDPEDASHALMASYRKGHSSTTTIS